ncbi:MAG: sulfotransferase domain-containing protein [bacterium]
MPTPCIRPTTVEEIKARLRLFGTEKSNELGKNYQPDPSDVFITTYPKCGTTWMQQMVHCLRTRGDMNFEEITEVVPWLELSHDLGVDNNAPQKTRPHAFKSHFSWSQIPKGGRYIHVTRSPEDVLISFYRFFDGWFFDRGSIDLDTFATELFLGGTKSGKYWNHVNDWWPQRHRENVLIMTYEDMIDDPERSIFRVADFIGIELDAELLAITLEKSSASFMRRHVTKFDDHPLREIMDPVCGLPPSGNSAKVSRQDSDSKKPVIGDSLAELLQGRWSEIVFPATGLADYHQLRQQLTFP